ncbi:MAG: LPS assembly protein LptD [Paracoccaceae bacterium]|nr:LPS assembly protein LptD [Paracoccaceae bacterium]
MRRFFLVLILAFMPLAATAQATPTATSLIADYISVNGNNTIIASGNVEVLHGTTLMRAQRIQYTEDGQLLVIEGPIYLVDGEDTVFIADSATLSKDLTNGVMRSARLVLNQQLQIAAAEINRVDGRFVELTKTTASSCEVCAKNPVPLWQIRAKRIIHDQEERQLYFEGAQFQVLNVPVMYFPRLRLPDPSVKRSTGFLTPKFRNTDRLGNGIKAPYFIAIGDSRDLTLEPYLTSTGAKSLSARYRQAFKNGTVQIEGALSHDNLVTEDIRGYLFANGNFDIGRDFELTFDLERVRDRAYLADYGLPTKDRLDSEISIARTKPVEHVDAGLIYFESLRTNEENELIPTVVASANYHKRYHPEWIGGQANLKFEGLGYLRQSNNDIAGRDVIRATAFADWNTSHRFSNGMIGAMSAYGAVDFYHVFQDSIFSNSITRPHGAASVELRWPFEKMSGGANHMIEPIVQLVYAASSGPSVPNEDATQIDFDEGNLFAFSRFPGADQVEYGPRLNTGITYTRRDIAGWSASVTMGRIFRPQDFGQFGSLTGLNSTKSDWVFAAQAETAWGLQLENRMLFDDRLEFAKNELRLSINTDRLQLTSGYIWIEADPSQSLPDDTSEFSLSSSYEFRPDWYASTSWNYDFTASRASKSGIGLQYRNECVTIDLSVARSYSSSTSTDPSTDIGLSVGLNGFGGGSKKTKNRRNCTG